MTRASLDRVNEAGGAWLRNGGSNGLGEDFGIAAAEVVGVDGRGIVEGLLLDTGDGKWQGIRGGRLGDDLRAECVERLGDGPLADYENGMRFHVLIGGIEGIVTYCRE